MAVVIRLQGLPVVAGSSDIRRFFSGLNIPDGGVHIIGGEKGEAFIIFATDEDARQGMSFSGRLIKDSRIELFLSSKTEMQNLIEVNRKRFDHGERETRTGSRQAGSSNSEGSLSNLVAAIKKGIGKSSYDALDNMEDDFHSDSSHDSNTEGSNQSKKESFDELCVFIRGMPYSATEDDVLNFFSGLQVEEVTMIEKEGGLASGDAVVKFATSSDAVKALQRDLEFMGKRFIEVCPLHTWLNRKGGKGHSFKHFAQLNRESSSHQEHHSRRESNYMPSRKWSHSRSPPRRHGARSRSISAPRRYLSRSCSRSPLRRYLARSRSRSPLRRYLARSHSRSPVRYSARSHSRSPLRRYLARSRSRSSRRVVAHSHSGSRQRTSAARSSSPLSHSTLPHSSHSGEYYIHIKNLPPAVEKRDLRLFFGTLDIVNRHITLLKPYDHEKKREAFVQLTSSMDYQAALGYHRSTLFGQEVHIFPTSKKTILKIIGSSESKRSHERHQHAKEKKSEYSGTKNCVYVRNFPYDVTKVEVQKFFAGFNIDDSDIYLLHDDKGTGLGEALVRFKSEDQAQKAESLNRRRFLGTEVLLRSIPEEQMQEFGIGITSVSSEKLQAQPHAYARSEHLYAVDSHGPSISSEGPPVQENLNHPSDYRCSDKFLCPPDHFRGPPPFPNFCREVNPGGFHERHFMPDSNFTGGADRITLIKMKNIPFRAAPNEILDFFHGYKIIPESLSLLNNEYGIPSGEATLALVNYHEAVAAVNELNDRPFGRRKVRLTLV